MNYQQWRNGFSSKLIIQANAIPSVIPVPDELLAHNDEELSEVRAANSGAKLKHVASSHRSGLNNDHDVGKKRGRLSNDGEIVSTFL